MRILVLMIGVLMLFSFVPPAPALNDGRIELPPPQTDGGMPLMQALKERQSRRAFSDRELSLQTLSDLLWAAAGVNRPDTGGRTAPTAMNKQEIDIYVALKDGLFLYDAKNNLLVSVLSQDVRAMTGEQSFVKDAPVDLIFVADHQKMEGMTGEQKDFYGATDTGFISENVYLFCASAGLATVVRGWFNKLTLTKTMKLRPSQTIVLAQTVGYPRNE
ncbi:nitroreductase [Candidatus Velamenicoccus archaeovorus]|uniref:Nitroreductase n=1 Tax=Velamenicoccus archaeovorus TaxID=1930593 RepID=A0A410P5K4_VELA1|nr:SagB/ThcOx family dehydrogenase [Candidatus Velamenicoccus archaeovorus]QAT17467.1 nitroreductase [Candidatus Velamenicoccus archaeovorus]